MFPEVHMQYIYTLLYNILPERYVRMLRARAHVCRGAFRGGGGGAQGGIRPPLEN